MIKLKKIKTKAILCEGLLFLCKSEPIIARAIEEVRNIDLRYRQDGFTALFKAIVSQQLSVAAASTIWSRIESANLISEEMVISASEEKLRSCGLSRQKIRYCKALASAGIDFEILRNCSVEEVVTVLTKVSGIGRWTAEIYAMFSLGHSDVMPAGDLALQEGARMLLGLDERPTESELRDISKMWSPWQSVASLVLWNYYGKFKGREGI
ncbi:MAG: DNA-3-methyladenine glycosylase 2 family protein [Proteobacteria bacterium]|nr:DNA-3-methyladenine glycosylase 2 family protein [Pseudomonadota bacterium]